MGVPTSRAIRRARESRSATRASAMSCSSRERSSTEVADQAPKAEPAARTATSTSVASPAGTWPMTSSVTVSSTSSRPLP